MSQNQSNESEKTKVLPGEPVIQNHEYDGILELNNPLPGWWLGTFYITIVFSIGYYFYYTFGSGPTLNQEYEQEIAQIEAQKAKANPPGQSGPTEEEFQAAIADTQLRQKGKAVYTAKCLACHGAEGQGGIGPNLTDKFWIHGGKPLQVAQVIQEGILDKGMPPWKAQISTDELKGLVSFIKSLEGTNPPNAKGPQGNEE